MKDQQALPAEAEQFRVNLGRIRAEVGKVIVGQDRVVEGTLTALIAGGNVLLEGVPGLGKTILVKTLSEVLELVFSRIQFTPDLMPADIVGTNIMTADQGGTYRFEFRKGPIFTQLLLADEINRATPKTQSALLETMQEGSVTVGGQTYHLPPPFFVLATQNPIEQEGTYPLPEAQLDRFMLRIDVPYLSREELNQVLDRTILEEPQAVAKIMDGQAILGLRQTLNKVVVAAQVRDFAVRLVLATQPASDHASEQVQRYVRWGASPRAAQALIQTARVQALAAGRVHVSFADVRHFAREVLQHRVLLSYDGQAEGIVVPELVEQIIAELPEDPES